MEIPDEIDDRKGWYNQEYLKSLHWRQKRSERLKLDNWICVDCGGTAEVVHHLTYERLGNECIEDLVSLCHKCHKKRHGENRVLVEFESDAARHISKYIERAAKKIIMYDGIKRGADVSEFDGITRQDVERIVKKEQGLTRDKGYWYYDIYSGASKRKDWNADPIDITNMVLENVWKSKAKADSCGEVASLRLIAQVRYHSNELGAPKFWEMKEKTARENGWSFTEKD